MTGDHRVRFGWDTVQTDGAVHVVPTKDIREHSLDIDRPCPCGARVEKYRRALVIHASFDGREKWEKKTVTIKEKSA